MLALRKTMHKSMTTRNSLQVQDAVQYFPLRFSGDVLFIGGIHYNVISHIGLPGLKTVHMGYTDGCVYTVCLGFAFYMRVLFTSYNCLPFAVVCLLLPGFELLNKGKAEIDLETVYKYIMNADKNYCKA